MCVNHYGLNSLDSRATSYAQRSGNMRGVFVGFCDLE